MLLAAVAAAQIALLQSLNVSGTFNVSACAHSLEFVGGVYNLTGIQHTVLALLIVGLVGSFVFDLLAWTLIICGCSVQADDVQMWVLYWTVFAGSCLIAALCVFRGNADQMSFRTQLPETSVAMLRAVGLEYAPAWASTFQSGNLPYEGVPVFANCTCAACERLCKTVPGIDQPLCWLALERTASDGALQNRLFAHTPTGTAFCWLFIAYFPLMALAWAVRTAVHECTRPTGVAPSTIFAV